MRVIRALLVMAVLSHAALADAEERIVVPTQPDDPVKVTGLSAEALQGYATMTQESWALQFPVHVATTDDVPPVMGTYHVEDSVVTFTPRFPFERGLTYRVLFKSVVAIAASFTLPVLESAEPTTVSHVYPSADVVPENLLKLYVYFSAPMRGGDVYDNVRILASDGKEVSGAFVETVPELWDREMRRVTIIFHPGRIKRGLDLHEREGPPLRMGESYRLVVGGMQDARGNPIVGLYEKRFSAGPADREAPVAERWTVRVPQAGTRLPLRVFLHEPFDHALLERMITVADADEAPIAGKVAYMENETIWEYHPEVSWTSGWYFLVVHPSLEDLAGNRLDSLFDVDNSLPKTERPEGAITLEFLVTQPAD